jgi:hypothetical protein
MHDQKLEKEGKVEKAEGEGHNQMGDLKKAEKGCSIRRRLAFIGMADAFQEMSVEVLVTAQKDAVSDRLVG